MKLQSLYTKSPNISVAESQTTVKFISPRFKAVPSMDIFIKTPSKHIVEKALKSLKSITKSEYDSLTEVEKELLRSTLNKPAKKIKAGELLQDIKIHQYAAESIRQSLDKEYGAGNYVVIAIGRSLSSISKLLGIKIGEENVKNIPLSSLQDINPNGRDPFCQWGKQNDIITYKKFLSSIGLTRETVEKSNKKFIIMDYVYSGMSLKSAYKILTSDYFLGNKNRNITAISVQDCLPKNHQKEKNFLLKALKDSYYKKYSFVDKFTDVPFKYFSLLTDFKNFSNDTESYRHQLFGFGLLDSELGGDFINNYKNLEFSQAVEALPNQKMEFWSSPHCQILKDIFEDEYELDKALKTSLSLDKLISIKKELKNFKAKLDSFSAGFNMGDYYTVLRPKILQALKND